MAGEENIFQIEILEMVFQIINVALSSIVLVFREFMTSVFSGIFGGTTA